MGLLLQSCQDLRKRSFLHVGSQAHPLDVGGHVSGHEEFAVDLVHLPDGPPMGILKGWMTICIDAGHLGAMARY